MSTVKDDNFSSSSQTTNFRSAETVFTWRINGFSTALKVGNSILQSKTFKNERTQSEWYIDVSSGVNAVECGSTTLYLCTKKDFLKNKRTVKYFFTLKDSKNREFKKTPRTEHVFTSDETGYGFPDFIDRERLLKFLSDDFLQVQITMKEAINDGDNDIILRKSRGTQTEPTLLTERRLLLEKMEYSDVVIKVEDVEIPAHRAILAAASPVFADVLDYEMLESANSIHIQDFNAEIIRELVQYIYSPVAPDLKNIQLQRCLDLMRAADIYQLDELRSFFVKNIPAYLNASNVAQILAIADLHNIDEVKEDCLQYMCINKGECFKHMCFDSLADRQQLLELIISRLAKVTLESAS